MVGAMTTKGLIDVFAVLLNVGVVVSAFKMVFAAKVWEGRRLSLDPVNQFRFFALMTVWCAVRAATDAMEGRMFGTVVDLVICVGGLLLLMKMHADALKGGGNGSRREAAGVGSTAAEQGTEQGRPANHAS